MTEAEPRAVLERLIRERKEDYAALSRLIGRNAAYVQQFIRRGVPKKLAENDRRLLAVTLVSTSNRSEALREKGMLRILQA